jgi:hypothetical protein
LPSLAAREGTGILAASSALSRDSIVVRTSSSDARIGDIAFDRVRPLRVKRRSSFANDVSAPMIASWR